MSIAIAIYIANYSYDMVIVTQNDNLHACMNELAS